MPYLMQLPGLGLITALTVLAAIGDVTRFETARQLVGYAGLGARVHDSGMTHRIGRAASPRPDAATCGMCWWKRPGRRSSIIRTGKPSSRG
jgi:hypothetical protein